MIKISKKQKNMLRECAKFLIPALIIAVIWFGCTMKRDADAISQTGRDTLIGTGIGAGIGGAFGGGTGALIGGATGLVAGQAVGHSRSNRRYEDGGYRENRRDGNKKSPSKSEKKSYRAKNS